VEAVERLGGARGADMQTNNKHAYTPTDTHTLKKKKKVGAGELV